MTEEPKSPAPKSDEEDAKQREELARKRRELEERLKQEQYQRDDM